jgi:hypothetical protein
VANPLATILSAAMMLRFSLNQEEAAQRIEAAVQKVLAQGLRTPDIWSEGTTKVGTAQMGDAVVKALADQTQAQGETARRWIFARGSQAKHRGIRAKGYMR